ncbi:MAG: MopE-related protein [Candidatus Diapherotrites archaeon]
MTNFVRKAYCCIVILILVFLFLFTSGCLQPANQGCIDNDKDGFGSGNLEYCASKLFDCNDFNPSVHPGFAETCNGIDDDCDGIIDNYCDCKEGETKKCGFTDVGLCEYGIQKCIDGVWSDCNAILPKEEICDNGLDEDCDGNDSKCLPCKDGIITKRCICGQTIVERGYCCNGNPSEISCSGTEEDPIETVLKYPLEEGWQRHVLPTGSYDKYFENNASNVANIEFTNDKIICRYGPMFGFIDAKAKAAFCFFNKGGEPTMFIKGLTPWKTIYTGKYTILVFSPCGEIENIDFIVKLAESLESLERGG